MALVVVVVLALLFAALLLDCCPLLDARVVALELNPRVGWEVEDMLHGLTRGYVSTRSITSSRGERGGSLPDLDDTATVRSSPDA